jgi:S-adenosylmethionine hydrolase
MRIISLTTDFGIQDGYVGVMKAVIYRIAPEVKIIDLSHMVRPQNILQGGMTAIGHIGYFPEDSIHVLVVDPGVGTSRRPIAAKIGDQYYVAPDNGLLTPMIEQAQQRSWPMEFVELNDSKYWLDYISHTFHARDIFAPVAAHLAVGVTLHDLGAPINDPVLLPLPRPKITQDHVQGEVIYVDHYGNLVTNIRQADLSTLDQTESIEVTIADHSIHGITRTFGEGEHGSLIALLDENRSLGISVVNGSAAQLLNASVGEEIEVRFCK